MILAAKRLAARPDCVPHGRARGLKAFGIRYEKAIERCLGEACRRGVWFEYQDSLASRKRYCQVDFLALAGGSLLVLEAKYTWVPEAWEKLLELYLPVAELALGKRPLGAVVCKNLGQGRPRRQVVCHQLEDVPPLAAQGMLPVVHWIGTGRL